MNGQLQLAPSLRCLIAFYLPCSTYMRLWDVDDVIKFMPLLLHEVVAESGTFRGKSLESLRFSWLPGKEACQPCFACPSPKCVKQVTQWAQVPLT